MEILSCIAIMVKMVDLIPFINLSTLCPWFLYTSSGPYTILSRQVLLNSDTSILKKGSVEQEEGSSNRQS